MWKENVHIYQGITSEILKAGIKNEKLHDFRVWGRDESHKGI